MIGSLTPTELRERLKNPPAVGNAKEFLRRIVGSMTEEEADRLERAINEMNERVDEEDQLLP